MGRGRHASVYGRGLHHRLSNQRVADADEEPRDNRTSGQHGLGVSPNRHHASVMAMASRLTKGVGTAPNLCCNRGATTAEENASATPHPKQISPI